MKELNASPIFVKTFDNIKLHSKNLSLLRKKVKQQKYLLKNNQITLKEIQQSFNSWQAHAKWGRYYTFKRRVVQKLFSTPNPC